MATTAPEMVVIDGHRYYREDVDRPLEPRYNAREIHEKIPSLSIQRIYRAMDDNELAYFVPNGSRRGRLVRHSELVRWLNESEVPHV